MSQLTIQTYVHFYSSRFIGIPIRSRMLYPEKRRQTEYVQLK